MRVRYVYLDLFQKMKYFYFSSGPVYYKRGRNLDVFHFMNSSKSHMNCMSLFAFNCILQFDSYYKKTTELFLNINVLKTTTDLSFIICSLMQYSIRTRSVVSFQVATFDLITGPFAMKKGGNYLMGHLRPARFASDY